MVLKVYGTPGSLCTKRVAVVLYEKQIPFKLYAVDMAKGENKSPEYLEKQPFGQIPYIDDDGFIIYESRAIGAYIATKYPDQGTRDLIPKDPKTNALYLQAASVELAHFDEHASKIVWEKVIKPKLGLITDQAAVDDQVIRLAAKLDVYDKILSRQKYVAGNELTLADLYHLPYASLLGAAGIDLLEKRPNVLRWYKEISARPSWQAVKDTIKGTA
ncbi:hypothetical protein NLJ89_g2468 [Agrocybe chaxingu]|uniref:glutathione transferase n=1 Tax=Agrocybe chaxingu TaxID=84603 RepID=A0A9W8KB33_9AGAR|nr:hypothetical protein NLJ89_g2468 [Agrocybe chaxingu]